MDQGELLDRLKQASQCSELCEVRTFKGYRHGKDGSTREVSVQILDAGPGNDLRYHIIATDDAGREASGNPDARLDVVIATVHWGDLDRELRQTI